MQSKAQGYHVIPIKIATVKKNKKMLARMWTTWKTCALLVRMLNCIAAMQTSMVIPLKN